MNQNDAGFNIKVLWGFVILLISVFILTIVIAKPLSGEWQCIEWLEEQCYITCSEGIKTTTYQGDCNDMPESTSCSGNGEIGRIKSTCLKEAWIKKVND